MTTPTMQRPETRYTIAGFQFSRPLTVAVKKYWSGSVEKPNSSDHRFNDFMRKKRGDRRLDDFLNQEFSKPTDGPCVDAFLPLVMLAFFTKRYTNIDIPDQERKELQGFIIQRLIPHMDACAQQEGQTAHSGASRLSAVIAHNAQVERFSNEYDPFLGKWVSALNNLSSRQDEVAIGAAMNLAGIQFPAFAPRIGFVQYLIHSGGCSYSTEDKPRCVTREDRNTHESAVWSGVFSNFDSFIAAQYTLNRGGGLYRDLTPSIQYLNDLPRPICPEVAIAKLGLEIEKR